MFHDAYMNQYLYRHSARQSANYLLLTYVIKFFLFQRQIHLHFIECLSFFLIEIQVYGGTIESRIFNKKHSVAHFLNLI